MDLVPVGPRRVAPKGQVTIPAELLAAVGLTVGDKCFVALNPDRPGTIVLIPMDVMVDVFRKGWTASS